MRTPSPHAAGAALAVVLSAGLLAGCADEEPEGQPATPPPTSQDESATTAPSPAEAESEPPEDPSEPPTDQPGDQAGDRAGEDPTDQPSGDRLSGEGYSFAAPTGWNDITASYDDSAIRIDTAVQAPAGSAAGAGTNINVIREAPEGLPGLQALAPQLAEQLQTVAKAEPEPLAPTRIDGEPAIGQTATGELAQGRLTFVQRFTIHDGALYSITLTSAPGSAEPARQALDGVLASWAWE